MSAVSVCSWKVSRLCVLLLFAACAHARPWQPSERSEDVLVIDAGTVVRFAPDGGAVITVSVALDGVEKVGVGSVVLRRAPAVITSASLTRSPHVRFARARAWYVLAATLLPTQPRRAYDAATSGVEELSMSYIDKHVIDDSTRHLWEAGELLKQSPPAESDAANLVMATLRKRLRIYTRKWRHDAE